MTWTGARRGVLPGRLASVDAGWRPGVAGNGNAVAMRRVTISVVRAIVLAGLTAALLAAGCSSDPAADLSAQQAVSAARRTAQRLTTTPLTLISARSGDFREFDPNAGPAVSAPDRRVWAVVFQGTFPPASCGPPGGRCPAPNSTMRVIIDAASGAFIEAGTYSAPAPPG